MLIDLRSDTVTKPTGPMLKAMFSAKVGDDVFGEDPTVIALEKKTAEIFGKEDGLFCPSGTMTNQVAIKVHTQPGDEVVCDILSHIYNYEGGGIARNSGCSVKLLHGNRGRFSSREVMDAMNPDDVHFPLTRLVSVENTCNKGGGSVWDVNQLQKISKICKEKNLKFHLDGARIFNACHVYSGNTYKKIGNIFDSVSICLSKGLGAPCGSVLIGSKDFIKKARRIRKVFGGGMRQSGYLAAAGIYALDNNIERLKDDHARAQALSMILSNLGFVKEIFPVETNIVIFELEKSFKAEDFIKKTFRKNIQVIAMGPKKIRMVTHLDFSDQMLEKVMGVLKGL